jgi:hypothetical protein
MTPPDDGTREEVLAKIAALLVRLGHKPDPPAHLSEELASLREAVDGMKQQLATQHHGCCHHVCWHYSYPTTFTATTTTYPYIITTNAGGAIT